jgi:diacylglycerol kinase family enzyme
VIRHPNACDDSLADRVRGLLNRHGYTHQRWTDTTVEHPGGGQDAWTTAMDADLVVVCGGDGTVRACADVLAGTGVPLAVVPCGTGNLLARNLQLPLDAATALDQALAGAPTGIDVGRVHGDGLPDTRFIVMAGAGFDAAMVRGASERLKARLGWAAYVVSAARHLRDPRMRLSIRLDDGAALERRARMVVIGNVGALQGGLPLLPDARPDSGRLDVVLLDPRGVTGWLAAAGHFASRTLPGRSRRPANASGSRPAANGALEYFTAERIDIRFAGPQPRELDGDSVGDGLRLTVEVEPGALRMQLPRPTEPDVHRLALLATSAIFRRPPPCPAGLHVARLRRGRPSAAVDPRNLGSEPVRRRERLLHHRVRAAQRVHIAAAVVLPHLDRLFLGLAFAAQLEAVRAGVKDPVTSDPGV